MSSQELKKKEKGKEIISFEENSFTSFHHVDHFDHTDEVAMYFSEEGIASLLQANKETYTENIKAEQYCKIDNGEKVGIQEKKSSSSKITPCIFYTSDDKARLRWSNDLHDCFVNAVAKLGGPDKATPKSVKAIMEVEGIALHHVKSHLQKFRLGKCNIRNGTDQYSKRFKSVRGIAKTCSSPNLLRPQVNIRPKVMRAIKPKKVKDDHGSLYMLIEHDLYLQRCCEEQRMQMTSAIEKQRNMFDAQYLKASMNSPLTYQDNNYNSTGTIITLNEPRHGYNFHPTHEKLQFNNCHPYNMIQGSTNPYTSIEPQSMHESSKITTQKQLQLNNHCVTHDSRHNATFLPTTLPPVIDSSHQGTSSNTIPFWMKPLPVQTYIPHHTYSSYPPYNTLEVVRTQLSALQNTRASRIQETLSCETNLSSPVTRDEVDPVDKYIDWDKVKEMDFELDPVEVLEALGFGVSP